MVVVLDVGKSDVTIRDYTPRSDIEQLILTKKKQYPEN
jgi:hypothetical protein